MSDDPFSSGHGSLYSGGFPADPVFSMPAASAGAPATETAVDDDPFAAFSSAPAGPPPRPTSRTSAATPSTGDLLDGFGAAALQRPFSAGTESSGPIHDDLLAGFISSTGND